MGQSGGVAAAPIHRSFKVLILFDSGGSHEQTLAPTKNPFLLAATPGAPANCGDRDGSK